MTATNRWVGLGEPLTVGAAGAAVLIVVNPPDAGPPLCPSVWLFATPCPLCGLTRGVTRFVRGDIGASLAFHPLAWIVLALAVGAWVAWFGRRAGWWHRRSPRLERGAVAGLLVALALVWVLRLVTGTLPPISG